MVLFFLTLLITMLSFTASQWQCVFCYYPYNPYPYPYVRPSFYPPITPVTPTPPNRSIGPCVNGQCPAGHGCYKSQCIPVSNIYGTCINNQCAMGFCYNGQCVG